MDKNLSLRPLPGYVVTMSHKYKTKTNVDQNVKPVEWKIHNIAK